MKLPIIKMRKRNSTRRGSKTVQLIFDLKWFPETFFHNIFTIYFTQLKVESGLGRNALMQNLLHLTFCKSPICISLVFVNSLDVLFQSSWLSEWFSTRITFVISLSFLNYLDVSLEIFWISKGFSTKNHICDFCVLCECFCVFLCWS